MEGIILRIRTKAAGLRNLSIDNPTCSEAIVPVARVAATRPYAREALIKQVVAVAGDRVCIDAAGVRVNGELLANSAPLPVDRDGLPLPQLALQDYTLREGELLTMSTYNPRSFDSRYFGPVQRGSVVAVVEPLLTW